MREEISIIGGGLAGLSAASSLAQLGFEVTLFEKNSDTGGRNRSFSASGFTFDMGPSWYWMPDVFESYFARFGKKTSDYFDLVRLDPSYKVFFPDEELSIPSGTSSVREFFDRLEPGSGKGFDTFLREAKIKYETGMQKFAWKPSLSIGEFVKWELAVQAFRLQLFTSVATHIRKYFSDTRLIQLLEFPVLFLGAKPSRTPAMYSMMNYADIALGTWYPMGGMHKISEAMTQLAVELGVKIRTNSNVEQICIDGRAAHALVVDGKKMSTDAIVGAADYQHIESKLIQDSHRTYSEHYWSQRTMSPSSLLFYVGVNKKITGLEHHNLFFDTSFDEHTRSIYDAPEWPRDPLFYLCCPSKTDSSVAPEGMENLFFLVPVATGLTSSEADRDKYFDQLMDRVEKKTGQNIREHVVFKRSYAHEEFVSDYNAFRGNAYGLANTLGQTAFLKPSMRSKKIQNMFFAGQLTVPGPGVPPAIISGQIAASEIQKYFTQRLSKVG